MYVCRYGECLFTSNVGVWGAAICTCDTALCNNLAALSFIVDRKAGPMRLLQFLDGSLASSKDAINAVVPGLMDATGIFVASKAGGVTKVNVDDILKIASVAAKTNTDELWGLVQDFVKLNKEIAEAKSPATTGVTTPNPFASADYSRMKNEGMDKGKEWTPNAAGTDGM